MEEGKARAERPTVGSEVWMEEVFSYHAPTADQALHYVAIRSEARRFAECIVETCPPSADRTVALRKVREAVMVANASIATGGIA